MLLLTGIAALLMTTSAAHARPRVTYCSGDWMVAHIDGPIIGKCSVGPVKCTESCEAATKDFDRVVAVCGEPSSAENNWTEARCQIKALVVPYSPKWGFSAFRVLRVLEVYKLGADWKYDYRRCAAGHKVGEITIRISSLGNPMEFDIAEGPNFSVVDFKVASVRIDQADFPVSKGYAFEYALGPSKPILKALALGKRLQVFAEGQDEPVADLRYNHGKRTATFLRRCG
jgi:hypothetical protein